MSVYLVKRKGWRYDFTKKGTRYTNAWFQTKQLARQAESKRREEIKNQKLKMATPTDITFLDLLNKRLDYVKAYNSGSYYRDYGYMGQRWVEKWGKLMCGSINGEMVEKFIIERSGAVSANTANVDLRCLRAAFNYGKKKLLIPNNPTDGIDFLPVEKKVKSIPPINDINEVLSVADPDTKAYLWTIKDTMGRISEINRLTWDNVSLEGKYVVLHTRKKKEGHLTPRKVPMIQKLFEILSKRYSERDKNVPWVFWHRYWSRKTGNWEIGPYQYRKRLLHSLCEKAGVKPFQFHALRHAGASLMDNNNVPIGAIQRILGHESRTTTEIYLHSMGSPERAAIEIYEKVSRNPHTESHTDKEKGLANLANPPKLLVGPVGFEPTTY